MGLLNRLLYSSGFALFVFRRVLAAIPVLLMIALVSFLMIRAIPGGPFVAIGQRAASPELIAALEKFYGLDRPLLLNLPGSDPNWQLLDYVDESESERVTELVLPAAFQATLNQITADTHSSPAAAAPLERLKFHAEQGITPEEMPAILADLAALRDDVQPRDPTLAAQIGDAIAMYDGVDLSSGAHPTRVCARRRIRCFIPICSRVSSATIFST